MADLKDLQGSKAQRAEGGLDVEAAFTALNPATDHRLGMEVKASQGKGAGELLQNVRQQMAQSPGGVGAAYGRDDFGGVDE